MANVKISDLPQATLPLIGTEPVEIIQGGISKQVLSADLIGIVISDDVIVGTSIDDPSLVSGVFNGTLTYLNVNLLDTATVGFNPAGDDFRIQNLAQGGVIQLAIRDGTVLAQTTTALLGGLFVNNLLTGAGLERVLTTADVFNNIIIGTSIDDPTNPAGGGTYDGVLSYQNSLFAATAEVGFDPAGDTLRSFNKVRRGSFAVRVITGGGVEEDTYRYDGFAGSHTWLDVLNTGILRMTLLAGNSSAIILGGVNLPSTGAAQTGNFRMTLQDGTETGEMGFPSSVPGVNIEIKNFVHGAQIRLTGEDGAGVERILFLGDPDGTGQLYFAGSRTIVTQATGTAILGLLSNDPTTGGVQDSNIVFQNLTPVAVGDVGFVDGDANIILYNRVHGGDIILRGEDESGNVREVYKIDFENVAGGLAHIWREPGGTRQLMRLDTGVNAVTQKANTTNQPSGGFAQVGTFRVLNRNASPETAMFVGFNETIATTTLRLKNFVHGGPLELVGETAAGVERVLFFHDPDQVGPIFTGILDNDPAVDASIQDARMTFRNPSADNIWQIGFLDGTNDFSIRIFQDTGIISLRAPSAASGDRLLATFDPIADVKLFQAGIEIFRTVVAGSGGAELNNTLTGAGFERVLTVSDIGGAASAGVSPFDIASAAAADPTLTLTEDATLSFTMLHDVSTDIMILRNEVNSGHLELRGRDSSGVDALLLRGDPDNQTTLFWDGTQRIRTAQQGTELIGSTATGSVLRMFASNGTTLVGLFSFGSSQGEIQSLNNAGAAFQISGQDAGSVTRIMFRADPDNTAALYHAGEIQIRTRDDGMEVRGEGNNNPATGGTQDFFLQFVNDAIQEIGGLEFSAAIDMTLTNRVHGGDIIIRGEDGGGVLQTMISMDPDDDVELFDDGTGVIRTQQAGLGGAEVNNTFTGAGYERVLTNTDADNLSIFTRNAVDDNVPSAVFVNGVLTISLAANETYAFEFYFEFQTPNASGDDFVLRFDNQAGWAGTVVVTCDNDAGTEHFSMDVGGAPATSITVNSDTTSNTVCKGIGVIVTDATPGTFELDVAKSADAGGDGTFFANSWMRVQLLTV
jgi:hypothetical protein